MTPLIHLRPSSLGPAFIGTIVPDGDDLESNWTNESASQTNIFASCNDVNDSTFATTDDMIMVFCGGPAIRTLRLQMGNPSPAPNGAENVVVTFRARLNGTGAAQSGTMQMRLYDGTTLKATKSSDVTLSTTWTNHIWSLTQAQKDAMIGFWNSARCQAAVTVCETTGDSVLVEISRMEVVFS